jgi:hypothetical protein
MYLFSLVLEYIDNIGVSGSALIGNQEIQVGILAVVA